MTPQGANTLRTIELPYGRGTRRVSLPDDASVVQLPTAPEPRALAPLLDAALANPFGARALEPVDRVTIIVSDASRHEPRAELVAAVLRRVGDAAVTLAIANGTHRPGDPSELGLSPALLSAATVVNHDANDAARLVQVGTTARGTALRVNRCLVEADLVVATGRIKPHYFAGFGAGAKALFPGLGANDDVRVNHRLKTAPGSRAGVVDGNPCREDLEEIVDALACETHLLNVVTDGNGGAQAAVAGDLRAAFRRGAAACAPLFTVDAPSVACIVIADELPLTASLYQASKLVAAAAPKLLPGGHIVLVAACPDGPGPIDVINRGIYDIGLAPRLPDEHTVHLVSTLPREVVEQTYCRYAPSVESVLEQVDGAVLVLPRGGDMLWAQ